MCENADAITENYFSFPEKSQSSLTAKVAFQHNYPTINLSKRDALMKIKLFAVSLLAIAAFNTQADLAEARKN